MAPVIETARLILRPPIEADLDALAGFAADEEAMRFLGGPMSRPEAWRVLAMHAGSWALRGYGNFSVIERASGRWVGRAGPFAPEGWPGTEVGWSFSREVWGRGYATEAAAAAIDWAIATLGWTDIVHVIGPDNLASAAVATRLGSTKRGPCQLAPPHDKVVVELWGQTAAEWRRKHT
jgi:RimJ/RimL family protein N-acetyltransferase